MSITLLWMLTVLLMLVGLAGTVLPVLPGTALVFAGAWLGAWIDGYERVGVYTVVVLGVMAALAWALDYVAALMGAKRVGASPQALVGAAIGTVAGLLAGFVGVLFMPFIGAAAGEYLARRDEQRAMQVGLATGLGLLLGMVAKVAIAFAMVGVFIVAWLV
ncbi:MULTISPECIES: DUF456 domain-containing protein [Rubrivivax]|uniref:DUF456 domain-containing protein n=1 Tax=Rubrivivax benzoatilyticus TaxID=316997 RepID=A0ABX0HTZ4_9BURK|nr:MULTISPECIES: DUF456 family protein [Rubrivivax]EGJ10312.1 hypothetical protein RBXJA2T_08300 [Rubrivivax benzoatilyticus JA2 = ATCC BAA-35]MCC9597375.1 DUF456 family protein [Rubrivivax sp. JA1055]MCC9646368.1 DUF456 family protein [Rubrivivax sp. JA1029]NHK98495.1 DUF456 domain-containing protein [Rubrivivax benzoatilyticus]NHL23730.1 DUF456 domain-containing protein [Rubrivivax benzoatilyticus]